jgi:hypothetical protein
MDDGDVNRLRFSDKSFKLRHNFNGAQSSMNASSPIKFSSMMRSSIDWQPYYAKQMRANVHGNNLAAHGNKGGRSLAIASRNLAAHL